MIAPRNTPLKHQKQSELPEFARLALRARLLLAHRHRGERLPCPRCGGDVAC